MGVYVCLMESLMVTGKVLCFSTLYSLFSNGPEQSHSITKSLTRFYPQQEVARTSVNFSWSNTLWL